MINKGAGGTFSKSSNAVSVPIGQAITVTVRSSQTGSMITVDWNRLLNPDRHQLLQPARRRSRSIWAGLTATHAEDSADLDQLDDVHVQQARRAAVAGPSYVQALNPPFVPFTSSGSGPGGAFTLK